MKDFVDSFWDEVASLTAALCKDLENPYPRSEYVGLDIIRRLADLVTNETNVARARELLASPRSSGLSNRLQRIYEDYDVMWEAHVCLNWLSRPQVEVRTLRAPAASLWPEADILGLTSDSQVVFVGCGPYPATALSWGISYGATITCLEYNPVSASLAARLVTAAGLEDRIRVLCVNAAEYDYSLASHVAVAVMTHGKYGVMEQIASTMPKEGLVTCRTKDGLRACLFPGWPIEALERFEIVGKLPVHKLYDSLLLVPKKG